MRQVDSDFSTRGLAAAAQLVRAYTDSVDGDVAAEVHATLENLGNDPAELRRLVASIAGVAGHAVMIIATRLEAEAGREADPVRRLEKLSERREDVLDECLNALREFRPASVDFASPAGATMRGVWERRSASDRRIGSDRRRQPSGSSAEKINVRLHGERRLSSVDRRSGRDRRTPLGDAPG